MRYQPPEERRGNPVWIFDRHDRLSAALDHARAIGAVLEREIGDTPLPDRSRLERRRRIVEARIHRLALLARVARRNARLTTTSQEARS